MSRKLAIAACVLGLTMAVGPAYASPSNKKIQLICNSASGDLYDLVGKASVKLCSASVQVIAGVPSCPGDSFDCTQGTPYQCNSGNTSSDQVTFTCDAGFKVVDAIFTQEIDGFFNGFQANDFTFPDLTDQVSKGGLSSTVINPDSGDTFTLKIK